MSQVSSSGITLNRTAIPGINQSFTPLAWSASEYTGTCGQSSLRVHSYNNTIVK